MVRKKSNAKALAYSPKRRGSKIIVSMFWGEIPLFFCWFLLGVDGGIFRKDVFFTDKTVEFWMVLWMGFVDCVGFFLLLDNFLRFFSEMELKLEFR